MRKFLVLFSLIFSCFPLLAQTYEEVEQYVYDEIFSRYEYCERDFFVGIDVEVENDQVVLTDYFAYNHSDRNGLCTEQSQACKSELLEKFPELKIQLVIGKARDFFNSPTSKHIFLFIDDTLVVDPSFKEFGLIDDLEGYEITQKYSESFCYSRRNLELKPNILTPFYFSGDSLWFFYLEKNTRMVMLQLDVKDGESQFFSLRHHIVEKRIDDDFDSLGYKFASLKRIDALIKKLGYR